MKSSATNSNGLKRNIEFRQDTPTDPPHLNSTERNYRSWTHQNTDLPRRSTTQNQQRALDDRLRTLSMSFPESAKESSQPENPSSNGVTRPASPSDLFLMRQRTSSPPGMMSLNGSMCDLLNDHFRDFCFHHLTDGHMCTEHHEHCHQNSVCGAPHHNHCTWRPICAKLHEHCTKGHYCTEPHEHCEIWHHPIEFKIEDVAEITLMTRLPNGSMRRYQPGDIPVMYCRYCRQMISKDLPRCGQGN